MIVVVLALRSFYVATLVVNLQLISPILILIYRPNALMLELGRLAEVEVVVQ